MEPLSFVYSTLDYWYYSTPAQVLQEEFQIFFRLFLSLNNIIRIRLSGCLIVPGILLFIDGRQPIGFRKAFLCQPSIPLRSKIFELRGRSEARHRFADGLCALQKAVTQHRCGPAIQKRVWIMLFRLYQISSDQPSFSTGRPWVYFRSHSISYSRFAPGFSLQFQRSVASSGSTWAASRHSR